MKDAIEILQRDTKTTDSPDTEYKIALTKYIEEKEPSSTYETLKDSYLTLEEFAKGCRSLGYEEHPLKEIGKILKQNGICPRTTEEGEG